MQPWPWRICRHVVTAGMWVHAAHAVAGSAGTAWPIWPTAGTEVWRIQFAYDRDHQMAYLLVCEHKQTGLLHCHPRCHLAARQQQQQQPRGAELLDSSSSP